MIDRDMGRKQFNDLLSQPDFEVVPGDDRKVYVVLKSGKELLKIKKVSREKYELWVSGKLCRDYTNLVKWQLYSAVYKKHLQQEQKKKHDELAKQYKSQIDGISRILSGGTELKR